MVDDFLLGKEIAELSEAEADKVLKKLRYLIKKDARYSKKKRIDIQDMEGANPTVSSSYPGQAADGYTSPAVIGGRRKMKQKIFK